MNIVKSVTDYFRKYTDTPNSALVRDVAGKIATDDPTKDESDVFLETVIKLRTDFGYSHPIEEQADRNDAAPFLAKTSQRGGCRENMR
jgi:hypothetical protein